MKLYGYCWEFDPSVDPHRRLYAICIETLVCDCGRDWQGNCEYYAKDRVREADLSCTDVLSVGGLHY